MSLRTQLIFIYGTLRRGGRAHHLMQGAEFMTKGSISGRLIHIDQYPGLILCDEQRVNGELYQVSDALITELDRYEGCYESPPHYLREEIEVLLENGETTSAQVYVFQLPEPHQEEIECGDWIEWIGRNL